MSEDLRNLLSTDTESYSVERDKAGEWADCCRPRDQKYLERADMVERSSTHGIYADRSEKSSVPGKLRPDMVERSFANGILTDDRAEKSSAPGELTTDMAEKAFRTWDINSRYGGKEFRTWGVNG